jgi:glycosyltransferase involved in cell wall biosynthesis
MRILQVSPRESGGGAENVAMALHRGYLAAGHEATLAVKRKAAGGPWADDPSVVAIPNDAARGPWARAWMRLDRAALSLPPAARRTRSVLRHVSHAVGRPGRVLAELRGHEDFDAPATARLLDLPPRRPDVLHCHNLTGGYFDLRALPALSSHVPVVLTMHDAWLLSGHCAHSFDCERWRTGCGHCPYLGTHPAVRRDATAFNWRLKADVYRRSRLYLAGPSRWMVDRALESMLAAGLAEPGEAGARVIPNGIDVSIFRPGDRAAARAALGLPADAGVLLFVAAGVAGNPFKDFATLKEALARLGRADPPVRRQPLVLLGIGSDAPAERLGAAEVRYVPWVRDAAALATYYQAADAYLHAARAESFGLVVAEAMACGTPAVATAVGGIPEQIDHGRNGWLVPPGDAGAIAAHVRRLLEDDALRRDAGARAAADTRRRFDVRRQVAAYLDWFAEVLDRRRAGGGRAGGGGPAGGATGGPCGY